MSNLLVLFVNDILRNIRLTIATTTQNDFEKSDSSYGVSYCRRCMNRWGMSC